MKSVWTLCLLVAFGSELPAEDWSQWRGPHRDGIADSVNLPAAWPERLKLEWKVEVGEGHSSPVIGGKNVYIHSRQDGSEVVTCLDRSSGKTVWKSRPEPMPYQMNSAARGHGEGPKSTPVLVNGQLVGVSISGVVLAWNAQTGALNWRRDFSGEFDKTSPLYGTATSPLASDGRIFVHVGGHGSGALKALDAATGRDLWSWDGDGPGYASPILAEVAGAKQLVTQSQDKIVGIDPADGSLLWEIPFKTPWTQNIVTPVAYRDLLIFSGLQNRTFAVRLEKESSNWNPTVVWEDSRHSMYMNSPVLSGDSLYGMAEQRSGQFFCMNAATGQIRWVSDGREGENASITLAGDLLFVLTDEAELTIIKAQSNTYTILARYTVADSPTWAHAVIQGSQILVKDKTALTSWTWEN